MKDLDFIPWEEAEKSLDSLSTKRKAAHIR